MEKQALMQALKVAHATHTVRDGGRLLETLAPRVPMDKDFVPTWRPNVGSTPAVAALTAARGNAAYAFLTILPPAEAHVRRARQRRFER